MIGLGGDEDVYAGGSLNNAIRHANDHGFLADLPSAQPPGITEISASLEE